jgi:hypothetical protein
VIEFKPGNLRTAPEGGFPFSIRGNRGVTLILVKTDGTVHSASNQGDKDALKSKYQDGDLLMLAWVGQWRTDIFHVTDADLERNYA